MQIFTSRTAGGGRESSWPSGQRTAQNQPDRQRAGAPRRARPSRRQLSMLRAAALGMVTAAVVWTLVPSDSHGVDVLVTRNDVAFGQQLTGSDLAVVSMDPDLVPDTALSDRDAAVDAVAAVDLPRGTPLTQASLVRSDAEIPAGFAKLAVTFADQSSVSVLQPGQRIRIFASADSAAQEVSVDATVVALTQTGDSATGSLRVTTLTVREEDASTLAKIPPGALTFVQVRNA